MAKQTINIGTTANDGTGDPIRTAFDKVNDNFTELYTDDAGDVNSVTATAPLSGTSTTGAITLSLSDDSIKEVKLDCTNAPTDNYLLSYDSASSGFTWVEAATGDITGVTAGDGLTGGGTSGTVSLAVGVDDSTIELDSDAVRVKDNGITLAKMAGLARGKFIYGDASGDPAALAAGANGKLLVADANGDPSWTTVSGDATLSAGALTIANDAVEHSMLENRYTAKATSTGTGDQNLNASTATSFLLTGNVATATLTIQNMKLGQVIDIQLTGTLSSAAITLATDFSSTTFYKVGSTNFDTAEKNVIQVVCIDDTAAAAIVNYSVGKLTADTTP